MTQQQKDQFAKNLGIPQDEQHILDAGGNHPFTCKCELCRQWWKLMGPTDADEEGNGTDFGPFTKKEVENA